MSRISRILRDFLNNWDTNIAIIGGIIVGVLTLIFSAFNKTNVPLVLSWTLITLGVVAVSIRRDRRTVKTANRVFAQQSDAYRYMIDIVKQYGAKEAVFIQYSCQTSMDLLRTVLRNGGKATVFIEHEDVAATLGSELQSNRIKGTLGDLYSNLGRSIPKRGKLKICKYLTPGTVSAIKIDNRVLCMGWYLYEKIDYTNSKHYNHDQVSVSGHDVAALVVWNGTDEFEALNKTFCMLEENYQKYAEEVQL